MSASSHTKSPTGRLAGARLSVDLGALAGNFRRLQAELGPIPCAAVVKADGYGLGIRHVGPALWDAGAREFFVAHPGEGVILRDLLPDAEITILNGALPGMEDDFRAHRLTPALNTLGDVARWRAYASRDGVALPAALHVDTGMCRLGLDKREFAAVTRDPDLLAGVDVRLVMSHLASADEPDNPQSANQLALFREALAVLSASLPKPLLASFAASSGIFLGPDYHFDLGRPGIALYGVNPTPSQSNPMAQVVRLQAKILQVRDVDTPETVGYGATHRVDRPSRIATLPVGYADGYLRNLSSRATAFIENIEVPLVGRVSMDLITIDVTNVPEALSQQGQWVDLIGPGHTVDDLAVEAGTIGYEILTSLGARYHRDYISGAD